MNKKAYRFILPVILACILVIAFFYGNYLVKNLPGPVPRKIWFESPARSIARLPGKIIVIGESNGFLRLYDEKKLTQLAEIKVADDDIMAITFSPDGKCIAAGSHKGNITILNIQPLRLVLKTGGEICRPLRSLAFTPDGKYLFAGDEHGNLSIFNRKTGKRKKKIRAQEDWLNSIDFSPDGNYFLTCSCDNTARIWRRQDLSVIRSHDCGSDVLMAKFSPGGQIFACATESGAILLWGTSTGEKITSLAGHEGNARQVCFSDDGHFLGSAGADRYVMLWDLDRKGFAVRIPGARKNITGLTFLTGNRLAVISADQTMKIWDINDFTGKFQPVRHLSKDKDLTHFNLSLALSPGGEIVATGAGSGMIRLWNTDDGSLIREFKGHEKSVFALDWDPLSGKLFSGSEDGTAGIWNPDTGGLEKRIKTGQKEIISLEVSPDGKYFLTAARDNTVKLWSTDGVLKKTFTGYRDNVHVMKFMPEKHIIVTVDEKGTVITWDYESGKRVSLYDVGPQVTSGDLYYRKEGPAILAFNRKPRNDVFLSSLQKGGITSVLKGHGGEVMAIVYSPSGLLVSGDFHGVIMLWKNNKFIKKMKCPDTSIRNLVFSDDGSILASGTFDGRVIIWDTTSRVMKSEIKG